MKTTFSSAFFPSRTSLTALPRLSFGLGTSFAFRYTCLSTEIAIVVWPRVSGLSIEFVAFGRVTVMPCCNRGATSIMMMRSTSMTSTSGVTLISDLTPPFAPPRSIAIGQSPIESRAYNSSLRGLPDEEVDQLRRGVVHFDVEVFDAAGEVVVEPHRRNRDDEPERGLDERFRNADRHGADAGRPAGADALERVDDADDGAEQSDERGRRSDGCERRHALLQVRGGERRGALNGAADRVHHVGPIEPAPALLLELILLQPGEDDFGEMAVAIILRRGEGDRLL